jgi:hypothetical protein
MPFLSGGLFKAVLDLPNALAKDFAAAPIESILTIAAPAVGIFFACGPRLGRPGRGYAVHSGLSRTPEHSSGAVLKALAILAELAFSQGDIESAFRFAMKIGNTDWLVASLTTGVRCFVHGFVHPNRKHKMRLSFWTV